MSRHIPNGWVSTTIGETAEVVTGKTPPTGQSNLFEGDLPLAKPGDLDGARDLWVTESTIAPSAFDFVPRLPAGSVLISCIGNLGKAGILAREGSCNQQLNAVLPTPVALPEFLYAWAQTIRPWLAANSSATTISIVNKGRFLGAPISLPPLNEQRRIIAKLEALQTRSRRAREALDAVPPLLEKLRQSILAAAFRGDLTKDWRAQQKDLEPATELLKRIRAARRQKWESTELAKLKSKGKLPADDQWKSKYRDPEPADTTGLPGLPDGWCWGTAEELSEGSRPIIYGIIKAGPEFPGGTPYVRVTEVVSGRIVLGSLPRCDPERAAKFERSVLAAGDILVSKDGTIGKVAFVPPELAGGNINQHVLRIATGPLVDRFYFARIVESPQCQRWMTSETKGIALQGVNVEDFRRMPMPLAPLAEQAAIVAAVDHALEAQGRVIKCTAESTARLTVLERAVLAKAFRGELVAQDPNDESAEAMLAYARATSESVPAKGNVTKRGRPRSSQRADQPND